jgi:alkanesulfonate monooxygenase SsuD/methylene tetrahydromethanopterin reductase-like flavin-dependent oxidoreductase (luciferase family)
MFPQQPTEPDAIVPFGQLARTIGAERLWLWQSLRIESHPALAYLAGTGCRISVGMAVALMVLRHPYDAALQARSLARLMGHPMAIRYGAAYPSYVRSVRGEPYAKPAAAVGEFVDIARRLANNQAVSHDGELFSVHTRLPPMQTPKVEIGAGVLRPGMARVAGRTSDLAMTWLTPLNYIEDVVIPAVAQGARGVQRPPRIVSVVHAGVERRGRNPMLLAQHGSISHLQAGTTPTCCAKPDSTWTPPTRSPGRVNWSRPVSTSTATQRTSPRRSTGTTRSVSTRWSSTPRR